MQKIDLTVSIVVYNTAISEITHVIRLIHQSSLETMIFIIDNSKNNDLQKIVQDYNVEYIFNNMNLGYGKAHNIAIRKANNLSKYHLIMNCDIDFDPIILKKAFDFMENDPIIGMVSPMIKTPNGEIQLFCRMVPTPLVLFGRRFIPSFLRPLIKTQLDNFLLKHKDYMKQMIIPNLPGCFMFVNTSIINKISGFDERFFMYVEDIDLSRRLHDISQTIYYPEIVIEHQLARGSKNNLKLMFYHIVSQIYYFNKWGWFKDKKRKEINKSLL